MSSETKHPLAWGSIDGPKGTDTNSWAAKAAMAALERDRQRKIWDAFYMIWDFVKANKERTNGAPGYNKELFIQMEAMITQAHEHVKTTTV